jgi:hypothetical protein
MIPIMNPPVRHRLQLHHVNITVGPNDLLAEIEFLQATVGLQYLTPGQDAPEGSHWFEGAGPQIHVSIDPAHQASERAHIAVDVDPSHVDAVELALVDRGAYLLVLDEATGRRLFCKDPGHNLWELRGCM